MESLMTAEGRRSARLARMTGTGDDNGTVEDDDMTQSRIAFNIREERRVLDRLRAAQPSPVTMDSLDFPETGGSTLMGDGWHAYYNAPAALASTVEADNADDSATEVSIATRTRGSIARRIEAVRLHIRGAGPPDGLGAIDADSRESTAGTERGWAENIEQQYDIGDGSDARVATVLGAIQQNVSKVANVEIGDTHF